MRSFFKTNGPWLVIFAVTDITFIILSYLIRPEAFVSVSLFIVLFSAVMIAIACFTQRRRRETIRGAVEKYISDPTEETKNNVVSAAGDQFSQLCGSSLDRLQQLLQEINDKQISITNYQEYIEAWTHEIKTPLALMTLVRENHQDEMSAYVSERLDYTLLQIGRDVELILYFARLQTDHVDYNYSRFRLDLCAKEVLRTYAPLADERKIACTAAARPLEVLSDRKVVSFVISQLVSNAIKYASAEDGRVKLAIGQTEGPDSKIYLEVSDNGPGVPAEDLPFIFEKGFTGNHPDRQKATGMGLYLAAKYAAALNIEISTEDLLLSGECGFHISLLFPVVS